ncbi:MAG: zinc-dependent alcohol dehydrogenase [Sphingorhabdus sp.]
MAIALVLEGPHTLGFEEQPDPPLGTHEVRVKTLYSGISAGTELTQYRGTNPFMHRRFDEERRLFLDSDRPSWEYPVRTLGYEEVGEVVETGAEAKDIAIGQRVYGTWNHRSHAVITKDYAKDRAMPETADPRIGIFSHIGAVALNGVHDAGIRLGDSVAVFGLGVPGQIVAQAARASGARVIVVDPDADRRALALKLGAHEALAPSAAEAIRDLTGGRGADICIEVSGAAAALTDALRSVAYASRVVAMGFYQGEVAGLRLGEEFHHNRIELISSQISGVAPAVSHRWSKPRLWRTAVELQHEGTFDLLPLITHSAPFADAPKLFEALDTGQTGMLQAVLEFPQ